MKITKYSTGLFLVTMVMLNLGCAIVANVNQKPLTKPMVISGDEELEKLSQQKGTGITGGPGLSMEDAYIIKDRNFVSKEVSDRLVIKNTTRYVRIVNVNITGSRDKAPRLGGLVIENCRNMHIQNCRVSGTKGLFINKSKDFSVTDCHLESNSRVNIYHSSNGQFLRNTVCKNLEKGVMLANSSYILVEGNELYENAAEGVVAWGHGGLKEPMPPSPTHHITIRNNNVYRNNWHGIGTEFGQDCEISGNVVKGNLGYGINVGSWSHRNNVFNNIVEDTPGQGIIVETSQDSIFENNKVLRSGDNAFWLVNSSGTIIRNNVISRAHMGIKVEFANTGRHALKVRQTPDGTRNFIENNKIENCFLGVKLSTAKNTCKNNIINQNRDGMSIGGNDNTIQENIITNNVNGMRNSGSNNRIETNKFKWLSNAIVMDKGEGNQIIGNDIDEVCFDNVEFRAKSHNNLFAENTIRSTAPGISLKGNNNTLEQNTIISSGWSYSTPGGIIINGGAGNIIRKNTFENSMIGLAYLKGIDNEIVENTFVNNETALWVEPNIKENMLIKNNIYKKNDKDVIDTESPPGSRIW